MFIHWGLYSIPAGTWDGKQIPSVGEWIMNTASIPVADYKALAPQFNPTAFSAHDIVALAKSAGMKYIVITSKHHDGFCLFPTDLTDWCVKSTPFHRDPLGELAAACKAEGIRLCFYYSIMDWHHPDWGTRRPWNDVATGAPDMDRYTGYMKAELKELITRYHPGVLWFDGEWESPWTHERGMELYAWLRRLDPDLIINNRIDKARTGPGVDKDATVGDYGTPEQTIPIDGYGPGVDWETCMTMNDTWGYKKSDNNWKSTETIIRNLIDIASKGGNYLLNVGPTGEGLIPGASVARLNAVGRWMKVNGQAIYGTTATPFSKALPWGRCTKKVVNGDTTLFLHIFNWPGDCKLEVPGLKNDVKSAHLLDGSKKVPLMVMTGPGVFTITLPDAAPDAISSTVVLELKGPPDIEAPVKSK
jgi:alpha-L-fucosidase